MNDLEDLIHSVYGASPGERVVTSKALLAARANDAKVSEKLPRMIFRSVLTAEEFASLSTRDVTADLAATEQAVTLDTLPVSVPQLVTVVPTTAGHVDPSEESVTDPAGTLGLDTHTDPSTDATYRVLTVSYSDEPQQKLVRWALGVNVREDTVEDAARLRSFIDRVVGLVALRALEDDLLNGDGTATNGRAPLNGILNTAGTHAYARDTVNGEYRIDALAEAERLVRNSGHRGELACVAHPDVLKAVRVEKDNSGRHLAPALRDVAPGITRYVPSEFMPAGTALVGDYRAGSALYVNGGFDLVWTRAHGENFLKGWLTARVRSRVFHHVARPDAFVEITAL